MLDFWGGQHYRRGKVPLQRSFGISPNSSFRRTPGSSAFNRLDTGLRRCDELIEDYISARHIFQRYVIPAKAGIQTRILGPRLRGDDVSSSYVKLNNCACRVLQGNPYGRRKVTLCPFILF